MKDLHEPIKGEKVRYVNLDDKKWVQLNQNVVSWIDKSVYHYVTKESGAGVIWRKL